MKLQRGAVKAIEEIKVDFNILRLHCGNRIRDAVFRKFNEIRQDSNIEMFQKEVLLKLADGIRFLQHHLPTYYEEISKRYCDIMRNVVYHIFADYSAAFPFLLLSNLACKIVLSSSCRLKNLSL